MRSRVSLFERFVMAIVLFGLVCMPPGAGAIGVLAAPTTTITVDPAAPDGLSGWWLAEPDVTLESDQSGTAYYSYDGGTQTPLAVAAGIPVYLTDVPQGESLLSAFTVNSGGETETPPATAALKVDSAPPSRPLNASWELVAGNTIAIDWDPCTDQASGVSVYAVYRNLAGPPFDPADIVGVTASPGYNDTSYPPVSGLRYAIEAWDVAGNTSLLSDVLVVDIDLTPPSVPSPIEAWLNAAGWARVSWEASFDSGTGLSHYLVYRSINGGAMELVGTVPASVAYLDDHDAAVESAVSVHYDVVAVDRAGNESAGGGPVAMGRDSVSPVAPEFTVMPRWTGDGIANDTFLIDWSTSPGTDAGSGVLFYEVRFGPDPTTPSAQMLGGALSASVPIAEDPSTLLYFTVRVQDRAGNIADSGSVPGRNVPVYNAAGADRIATSVAASAAGFDTAETVVFASGYNFPDALCAAALAGRVAGPVLLAGPGGLSSETLAELVRLGARNAYVIGGTAAVGTATFESIEEALDGWVTRVSGADRYATAAEVAVRLGITPGADSRAFVVTGEKFPDALSVGAAAYAEGAPILYARASGVPPITLATLESLGVDSVVIVGGTASVSASAEEVLEPATRVYGATRYETARAFAEWAIDDGVLGSTAPCVATGENFPDGLCAGPLAGTAASPVLLTRTDENAATIAWLVARRAELARVRTLGGPAALDGSLTPALWAAVSVP